MSDNFFFLDYFNELQEKICYLEVGACPKISEIYVSLMTRAVEILPVPP